MDCLEENRADFLAVAEKISKKAEFMKVSLPAPLDLPSEGFDLVVAAYSLYFFPGVISEAARVLRRGGMFLVITHSEAMLEEGERFFPFTNLKKVIRGFSAENGETQLKPYFRRISTVNYRNSLLFRKGEGEDLGLYIDFKGAFIAKDVEPVRAKEVMLEALNREGSLRFNKNDTIFVVGKVRTKAFCSFCGKTLKLDMHDGRERQVCGACSEIHYENPLPVASVILANRDREVILVKRAKDPFKGMWCCPIGFAETGESIEDAALRELKEETGVEGKITQLVDVSSHTNEFYGDLLIVTFEAEKTGGEEKAGDDALEYKYCPVRNLPKLAFDSQGSGDQEIRGFEERPLEHA